MRAGDDDKREFSTLSPRELWSPKASEPVVHAEASSTGDAASKAEAAIGRELLRGLCEHTTAKVGEASDAVPAEFLEIARRHPGEKLERDPILCELVAASVGDVLPASLASSGLIVAAVSNSMWDDAETRGRLNAVWSELQQQVAND